MKNTSPLRNRLTAIFVSAAIALVAGVQFASASDDAKATADENAPALPLTASFGKDTSGEHEGPYTVTLKNTSDHAITVHATIIWSVTSHNRAKKGELPAHEIGAGESWTINDLVVEDRVVVKADGHAKLELKVPAAK